MTLLNYHTAYTLMHYLKSVTFISEGRSLPEETEMRVSTRKEKAELLQSEIEITEQ